MPLSPDEVVNKRFSATKFRQGYDEEEVDEFLDEVVAELRRLTSDNEDLKSKLAACERRVGELTRGGATVSEPASEPEPAAAIPEPTPAPVPAPAPEPPAPAPAPAAPLPVAAQAPAPVTATISSTGPEGAASMLALAQKLHDEHVEAGRAEGAKVVTEAKEHADRLVREAEDKQRRTLGNLEQERAVLERKVEELRSFERDYRRRLKAYLEGQLRDLDALPAAGEGPDGSSQPEVLGGGSPLPTRSAAAHQQREAEQGDSGGSGAAEPPRFPFGN
jgi:DivIVA domain-containing protein